MSNTEQTTKVVTGLVRFSYPNLAKPTAMEEGQTKKYNIKAMVPKKDKETIAKIKKAIEAAKIIGKDKKWGGKIPSNLEISVKDGDDSDDEQMHGHLLISAKSIRKVQVVDKNMDKIEEEDLEEEVYGGCYGRVSISFYAYAEGKKGIACGLLRVQKLKDGERFGADVGTLDDDFGDGFADDFDEDDDIFG